MRNERRKTSGLAVVLMALVLAGCAGPSTKRVAVNAEAQAREAKAQQRMAIQSEFALAVRLWTVGYAVLKGAAAQCGEAVRPSLGLAAMSRQRVANSAQHEAIAEALRLDDNLRVMAVYNNSAAANAGIQVGDIVVASSAAAVLTPKGETRAEAAMRLRAPVTLQVLRNGQPISLTIAAAPTCDYPLSVDPSSGVNAYADGSSIKVTKGMMRLATEDRELALVVGHELAHDTMGHITKKTQNAVLGTILDVAAALYGVNTGGTFGSAGAAAYSQDFEAEADYVGLYYLALAGYDTTGAAEFWRRMAIENPASIKGSFTASHPSTPERYLALEAVSAEIHHKQDIGAALTPDRAK